MCLLNKGISAAMLLHHIRCSTVKLAVLTITILEARDIIIIAGTYTAEPYSEALVYCY